MKIHKSVTEERVLACSAESMFGMADDGFCIACGADAMGVEPDARNRECAECGEMQVFGGEELLHEFA